MSVLLALLAACQSIPANDPETRSLADGMYLVHQEATTADALEARADWITLVYDDSEVDAVGNPTSDSRRPARYFAVSRKPDVPLILGAEPTQHPQSDGRITVGVTLAPEYVEQLATFTRENLGAHVALIMGGEVVSSHGIKSEITGGKIQVSRCTDNRCEYILTRLQKHPSANDS